MSVELLTNHYFEFLSLKGGCTGLSVSIHVKMPHCWKSHVGAHIYITKCLAVGYLFVVWFIGACKLFRLEMVYSI